MNPEILDTITKIKEKVLSKYPYSEITELLKKLGTIGYVYWTIPIGQEIIRARMNDSNDSFFSKCQLTYAPLHLNTEYKRASTPNESMFYGSLRLDHKNNIPDPRFVSMIESFPLLRDKKNKGYRKITFGRWRTIKEIKMVTIAQSKKYYDTNPILKSIMDTYIRTITENKEESIEVAGFLADEFAKLETPNDYDYMISAIFSESYIKNGLDGILYPSVKYDGKELNVAIQPIIADNCLQLFEVIECSVYKYFDNVFIDNDKIVQLFPNQSNFTLRPITNQDHRGRENCLKILGLKSMKELED